MLNTDLHTQALKPEKRMRCEDFIKNLRGVDDCTDIDRDILVGIYERVKVNEFKPASDHVSQVSAQFIFQFIFHVCVKNPFAWFVNLAFLSIAIYRS